MWIDESDRSLYHAALAHGANHLVTIVAQSMDLLRQAGATDPAAVLRPLLGAALANALDFGDAALTGPVVRGDVTTIRAHADAFTDAGTRPPLATPTTRWLVPPPPGRRPTAGSHRPQPETSARHSPRRSGTRWPTWR